MELKTTVTPATAAKTVKEMSTSEVLTASSPPLKVELGENELNVSCPDGKEWLTTVHVHIVETDL